MNMDEDELFIINGPEPDEPLTNKTLGEKFLESLLATYNDDIDDTALVDAVSGRTISYKTLLQETCNLAEALRSNGYSVNTVIAVCSANNLEFFHPVLASLYIGATVATVNHNYTTTELKHILNISKPSIIFCSEEVSRKFVELKIELKFIEKIVIIDSNGVVAGADNLKSFVENALKGKYVSPYHFQPFVSDSSKLGAFILCSSGTTGLPKGVLLSHRNMATTLRQLSDKRYKALGNTEIGLLPFFHGYGLCNGLNCINIKSKIIVLKKFEEDLFLKTIQDYKVTVLRLAPPLAIFLEKSPKVSNYDLSSVDEILCGAAPLGKNTELELKKRLKNLKSIRQGYGLTEATLAVTLLDRNVERPGSCGKVMMFMSCKVRDPETGKSLGPNQVGELCFKGSTIMIGYYNDEKSTKDSFTLDGWLKTGDLGYYDNEGYFYIVDRLKELIKYNGFQVAPAELEALLLKHPKVRDTGVVGLPDPLSGELPVAFVVTHKGADVTEKELQDYIASLVSPQKRLRGGVIFVSDIPKNPSGKILRRELRLKLKDYQHLLKSKL